MLCDTSVNNLTEMKRIRGKMSQICLNGKTKKKFQVPTQILISDLLILMLFALPIISIPL